MAEHDADSPVETGRHKAETTAEAVKTRAATLGEQAKAGASALASGAKARVETEVNARAEGARDTVAEAIDDTAETLRTAAGRMSRDTPQSEAVHRAANTVSGVATQVRETDLASLTEDLSATARRHPAAFLAGAGLLGFAAGRFLHASARPKAVAAYDPPPHSDRPVPTGARGPAQADTAPAHATQTARAGVASGGSTSNPIPGTVRSGSAPVNVAPGKGG